MKRNSTLTILITSLCLSGCLDDSKTPPEKITKETAERNAQRDVVPGVETRNFVRKNGWADANSQNVYKVLYNYEMTLTLDLPEAILELAKAYEKNQIENQKQPGLMGINDWGNLFQIKNSANNWMQGQENFQERRDKLLSRCKPCVEYWNNSEGGSKPTELRRYSYLLAWSHFESMGFKDENKKGDGATWNITPAFMKTENGWVEAK